MVKINNCIVVNKDEKFETSTYEINTDEKGFISHELPQNLVLTEPDGKTWKNRYNLVYSGATVCWQDHYGTGGGYKILEVFYKKTKLYYLYGAKIQEVIDTLNRFKNIAKEELNQLYEEAQKVEKSALELELENLKEEKQKAKEEAKTYTEIIRRSKELIALIKGLDED